MPAERLRFDLEMLLIAGGAFALSYFISGQLISTTLTTILLIVLFFLIGLHMDHQDVRRNIHKKKQLAVALISIYLISPLIAYGFSLVLPEELGLSLLIIGISAASVGASVVWTNRASGDGGMAVLSGSISMLLAFLFVPAWLYMIEGSADVLQFVFRNIWVIGLPLVAGFYSQRLDNEAVHDLRNNFSKAGIALIILLLFVQYWQMSAAEVLQLWEILVAVPVMMSFVAVTFAGGYFFSKATGIQEKQARAIGFVTGVKAFAVALFIALQFGGKVIQFVTLYYFVSRIMGGLISEYFNHGDLNKVFKSQLKFFRKLHHKIR